MQKNQKNVSPRLAAAVAAALGVGTASTAALAQQAYTDEGAPLETIIVTATRREVNVQDVPFNMVALGPEALDELRITEPRRIHARGARPVRARTRARVAAT